MERGGILNVDGVEAKASGGAGNTTFLCPARLNRCSLSNVCTSSLFTLKEESLYFFVRACLRVCVVVSPIVVMIQM